MYFLNQNLAMRPASIVRDFHADLLRRVPHCLFDFVTRGPTAEGKPMGDSGQVVTQGACKEATSA